MFNYVSLIVLCFMFVLYCLRLGIEFSRLMANYKCILLLLLLLLLLLTMYFPVIITKLSLSSVYFPLMVFYKHFRSFLKFPLCTK